ncbi:uncharacterized protein KD926_009069 [Aspergillus affinis]|uniref:uncharacterized protein n=1 Tax=Aspergillus affinis TaxID=1070780 RepID=UPI0022FE4F42|nr:uncharacterized protein KD926_009069 [Aspergillus affinis]KAI9039850.1 hypothetical protein KD926_009069 [Aspergillus affinis]
MSDLDPYKPIDAPIDGPPLPFIYRNSWEVMLIIDISDWSMEETIGTICMKLCDKLETHRRLEQGKDALGEIYNGRTRLALTFHLSELPAPRQYTNPDAVYNRIVSYLQTFYNRHDRFQKQVRVLKKWRFIDTVAFGIYEIPKEIDKMLCKKEGCSGCELCS